jgi:hypothetical protein
VPYDVANVDADFDVVEAFDPPLETLKRSLDPEARRNPLYV